MIQRVIVQDINGRHVLNKPIFPVTEAELRAQFSAQCKVPILSVSVDSVGCALVVVAKRLPL